MKGMYNDREMKTGLWNYYYEDGKDSSFGQYKNGIKVGKWTEISILGKRKKVKY